jgi:phosphate transport system permease protein
MITGTLHTRVTRLVSHTMLMVCIGLTAVIIALLLIITGYVLLKGASGINKPFFLHTPNQDPPGILNGICGTAILLLLASIVGIPLGLLTGIYLAEYDQGSSLAAPLRFVCDLLAGVPSIVVGVLGYQLLVVRHEWKGFSFGIGQPNGWAGALALAFIMVPIVARTTEEMLRLVPVSYREASMALGATKARTILRVVLPSAMGSVATGVMLAIARVAGETAPLIFTAGLVARLEFNPSNPFPSITAQVYDFRTSPGPEMLRLAWAGVLVLISLIFLLNLGIRFATSRRK